LLISSSHPNCAVRRSTAVGEGERMEGGAVCWGRVFCRRGGGPFLCPCPSTTAKEKKKSPRREFLGS